MPSEQQPRGGHRRAEQRDGEEQEQVDLP